MAVTRLYFEIPSQSSDTSYTIDLARELSKFNRRLIRQKQLFTVYGGLYQDSGGSNAYISTAPHYWVTKRAVNRGFKAWRKQLSDAMNNIADAESASPLRTGKWSDFKIHLDSTGTSSLLSCKDAEGNDLPSGEWDYSTVTMPRPDYEAGTNPETYLTLESDQFDLMICGNHGSTGQRDTLNYSRVGLIKSWLDSREIPNVIDTPNDNAAMVDDPLTLMFYTGDADEDLKIVEAINNENDIPPYDADLLVGATGHTGHGAELQMQCIISPDSNSGVAAVAGFQALCGLVRIVVTGNTGQNGAGLILDVESNGVSF